MADVRDWARLQHHEPERQQAAAGGHLRLPKRAVPQQVDGWMGAMKSISKLWCRFRRSTHDLRGDCSGVAATEFAMIVPIMLVAFFGTVEFCSAVAVDRKVTIMARTLSDLTSQSTWVNSTATDNFFQAATAVMTPYAASSPTP